MADKPQNMSMLFVLYASAFIAAFNENIINVALVDICAEFAVSSQTAQWLVTGYMIVTGVVIALTAYFFKRFRVRSLFFVAAGCFLVGEIVCVLAPNFPLLLVFRLLQAIGSGLFIPIMMNTVLATVPRQRVGTYLAIGGACITIGPASAPIVSGAMVTLFGWRFIFVIPAVLIAVLVVCAAMLVRNFTQPQPARLDVLSVVLAAIGLTVLVFGLGQLITNLPVALAATLVGLALLALFARRQTKLQEPVLEMGPFSRRRFISTCGLVIIAMMTTFSMSVLLPLYFESSFGETALMAGLFILPPIAINSLVALLSGRIMDRFGEWPLLPIGFAMIVVGQTIIAIVAPGLQLGAIIGASVLVYCGVGLVMSPVQTSGLNVLPGPQRPSGVSIINVLMMVAASMGPSLFIGILTGASGDAATAGASFEVAQAVGFSRAVLVADIIALVGFIDAFIHAWRCRKHPHGNPDGK